MCAQALRRHLLQRVLGDEPARRRGRRARVCALPAVTRRRGAVAARRLALLHSTDDRRNVDKLSRDRSNICIVTVQTQFSMETKFPIRKSYRSPDLNGTASIKM